MCGWYYIAGALSVLVRLLLALAVDALFIRVMATIKNVFPED